MMALTKKEVILKSRKLDEIISILNCSGSDDVNPLDFKSDIISASITFFIAVVYIYFFYNVIDGGMLSDLVVGLNMIALLIIYLIICFLLDFRKKVIISKHPEYSSFASLLLSHLIDYSPSNRESYIKILSLLSDKDCCIYLTVE